MTGNGTTFALTALTGGVAPPAGGIGRVTRVGSLEITVDDIEDDDLLSEFMPYFAGDLKNIGELPIDTVFVPEVHIPLALNFIGEPFLGALTFPLRSGQTTPAMLAGSGYYKSVATGDLENNSRTESPLVWMFDSQNTLLTFTPST